VPELEKLCRRVETLRHSPARSLVQCVRAIPGATPFQLAYFRSAEMSRRVQRSVEEFRPDVVHTHLIRMSPYTAHRADIPRVLDLTDAVSIYLRRFADSTANPVKRLFLNEEWRRIKKSEAVLQEFDCSLVCAETDRTALRASAPAARIEILENGVDMEAFAPDPGRSPERGTIICTGNMSYFPNADGVKYLTRDIFPLIRREVPGARLLIVGQNPPASIRALSGDGITVTGAVPDIRDYYLRGEVAVSPIRFGSGTLNKVLEPMALGLPVVATSIGVDGLPFRDGEHLLIGRTPEQFADHVVRLLRDADLAHRIGGRAQELVRGTYSWETIARRLEGYYRTILQARSKG
jgi:glycosyltransferase involved in cell wall biosynthesis